MVVPNRANQQMILVEGYLRPFEASRHCVAYPEPRRAEGTGRRLTD